MEEILRRLGVPLEAWIISIFSAALIAIYRIFEPVETPGSRMITRIVIMGIISALLVPGLVVYWLKVQNAFFSAVITGLSVYCFEPMLKILKNKLIKKIESHGNS